MIGELRGFRVTIQRGAQAHTELECQNRLGHLPTTGDFAKAKSSSLRGSRSTPLIAEHERPYALRGRAGVAAMCHSPLSGT